MKPTESEYSSTDALKHALYYFLHYCLFKSRQLWLFMFLLLFIFSSSHSNINMEGGRDTGVGDLWWGGWERDPWEELSAHAGSIFIDSLFLTNLNKQKKG